MSEHNSYKHKLLEQGGSHIDEDGSVLEWLEFLTNQSNLRAGLPGLSIVIGNWVTYEIKATFDKDSPSLQSLTFQLDDDGQSGTTFFREENPPPGDTVATDPLTGSLNPHHLKNWVFAFFLHPSLKEIDISFPIHELPDLFDKLPNLQRVSLANSKLERLPPSFYRLPSLETLNINDASFPELPVELKDIRTLLHLSFSQPATGLVLGGLSHLTKLDCLTKAFSVPVEITQLVELKYLYLADVANAPENFLNFPHLEWLKFESKSRAMFRFVQSNVPNLQELYTNHPSAFVSAMAELKHLKRLTLKGKVYGPDVEALPISLSHLTNLTHLSIRDSSLEKIEFCSSLKNLEYLNVFENSLQTMPTGLDGLQRLKEIHFRKNNLSDFKPLPPNLEFLDLSENQMSSTRTDLSYLQKLTTLNLFQNRLKDLMKLPESLEHLMLGSNNLARITSGLGYLKKLKSLTLDTNKMEEIPELPVSLEFLDLSKNSIVHIPSGFGKLKRLKKLKVSKNPIADFPELEPMLSLQQLEFVETKIPESEYTNIPPDEVMQKLKRIFPNAELCFDTYI